MPVIKCSNSKYKWGQKGKCVFKTKKQAEKAGRAIQAQKAIKKKGGK